MDGYQLIAGLFVAALLGVVIGQDAEKRGMSGLIWGLLTFLMAILTVPIYLLVRSPLVAEVAGAAKGFRVCPKCNLANGKGDKFCKECGTPMKAN